MDYLSKKHKKSEKRLTAIWREKRPGWNSVRVYVKLYLRKPLYRTYNNIKKHYVKQNYNFQQTRFQWATLYRLIAVANGMHVLPNPVVLLMLFLTLLIILMWFGFISNPYHFNVIRFYKQSPLIFSRVFKTKNFNYF